MQQDPRKEVNTERPKAGKASRFAANDGIREIRISDLLLAIRRRLALIVMLGAAGLALGMILSAVSFLRGEIAKEYLITTSIAVTSQSENGLFISERKSPSSSDIYLAEDMVDAVIYVIRSDRTLNAAVERLDLIGVSAKDIYDNLRVSQYNETQIIELNLYWRSAQEGISILTAINQVVPNILITTLKIGSVSVINEPRAKHIIGGMLNASNWVLLATIGVVLGIGLAVLETLVRPTLLNIRDVEWQLGLELLGEIPGRSRYFRKKRNLLFWAEEKDSDPVVLDNFEAVAQMLQWQFRDRSSTCLAVTSASRNEGRTTLIAHLAVMLAGMGTRVLLMDLDTRNPRLGGYFLDKTDYSHSLNALYRGESEAEEAVTHLTGTLDLLPTLPEGRALPLDEAMCALVSRLKDGYDIVLIDTAPVGQAAETMSLSRVLDTMLFVVRFDGASLSRIREALFRIQKSGKRVMGCVVNGVRTLHATSTDGYDGYSDPDHSPSASRRRKRK